MKKLLAGLLLVSSVLSFGATQRVPLEKLVSNGDGELLYLEGQQKPYSGEVERKYPNGKLLGLATMKDGKLQGEAPYKNGQLDGVVKMYDENGKVIEQTTFKNGQQVK